MLYRGTELLGILSRQTELVKLFDDGYHCRGIVTPAEAMAYVPDFPIGVGNRNKIRELRPSITIGWTGGSNTIRHQDIRNATGEKVTGLRITEHRPIVFSR